MITTEPPIKFAARWREELVATSQEGTLIFELTMGQYHVYFPDQAVWNRSAPGWAIEKWKIYLDACQHWCDQNKIPLSVTDNALLYEDSSSKPASG